MTARDLNTVAMRAVAVFLLITALGTLAWAFGLLLELRQGADLFPEELSFGLRVFGLFVSPVLTAILAVVLLLIAPRLPGAPDTPDAPRAPATPRGPGWTVSADQLLSIGCRLLGIYSLLRSFEPAARAFRRQSIYHEPGTVDWSYVIPALAYLAAGLLLIIGARRIGRWLGRLRYEPPDEPGSPPGRPGPAPEA